MNQRIKKKNAKGNIHRDCWNLDFSFLDWLEKHLKVYKKDASEIFDLSSSKIKYKDKDYTQEEIINRMLFLLEDMKPRYEFDDIYFKELDELLDLWKAVFRFMWYQFCGVAQLVARLILIQMVLSSNLSAAV